MLHMRAALIYSQQSRRTKRDPSLPARVYALLPSGSLLCGTRTLSEISAALRDCASAHVETLFVLGGDGTHRLVIDAAIAAFGEASLPRLRFLRGGTMNTVCNALGLPRAQPEMLARLALDGQAREVLRPLLRVNAGDRTHHGFLFGTGVMPRFLQRYEQSGSPTTMDGVRTLGEVLAECVAFAPKKILSLDALRIGIDDGAWFESRALTVGAATVDQIGLGFRPFHGAQESQDAFRAFVLDGPAWRIPLCLPAVRIGRSFPAAVAQEHLCTSLRLEGTQGPIQFMIDGDLFDGSHKISVCLGPSLRLLV